MSLTIAAMPAYNEERSITEMVLGCQKYVNRVVVVDDGSSDATADRAACAGAHVIRHEWNAGYGAALRTCFEMGVDRMEIIDSEGSRMHHWIKSSGLRLPPQRHGAHRERTETNKRYFYPSKKPNHKGTKPQRTHKARVQSFSRLCGERSSKLKSHTLLKPH